MFEFLRVGVALGPRFAQPLTYGEMVVQPGAVPAILLFNPVLNETVLLGLGSAGPVVQSFAVQGAARVGVTVGGIAGSLPLDMITAAQLPGSEGMTGFLQAGSPMRAQAVEMIGVEVAGQAYLLASRHTGTGVESFRIGAGGSLMPASSAQDTADFALSGVVALAKAQVGSTVFAFAASAVEHGITTLSVGANGALTRLSVTGQAQGVPMQGITALESVTAFGGTWLVAAAAGSSSLTVFRVAPSGALAAVDHVLDELGTRFRGVTALDVVTHGDWVFVLAAGADEGVTLFSLLPDGRLAHLATVADRVDLGLSNISALRAVVMGDSLQVMVLSAAEAGVTQLSVSLAGLGGMGAVGTAGRDVILDGEGAQSLTGGAGGDLFVMRPDGQRDMITDFDPVLDRINLTAWTFIRHLGAMGVTVTANGAVLGMAGEELEIRTASGRPLTLAELNGLNFWPNGRSPLGPAPTPEDEPPTGGGTGGISRRGGSQDDRLVGGAGNDTLYGEAGNDRLEGGEGDDLLEGGAGADSLIGDAGNDRLAGGDGDDWISGGNGVDGITDGAGNDTILAGAGDERITATLGDDEVRGEDGTDHLDGGVGNDRLYGGAGNDLLTGGEGDDLLDGGDGADVLSDGAGDDLLLGGAGNDSLTASDGRDQLWGGDGEDALAGGVAEDTLWGGAGHDRLAGDAGNDTLWGEAGNDRLDGGEGDDLLSGGDGADVLMDGAGNDRLLGGTGNDTLTASIGDDRLFGGAGMDVLDGGLGMDRLSGGAENDTVSGGAGNDVVKGDDGDDRLFGGDGADRLFGSTGQDRLEGGAGNDWLSGGDGRDILTGGAGADVFVFDSLQRRVADVVTDFVPGQDRLQLVGVSGMSGVTLRDTLINGVSMAEVVGGGHVVRLQGVVAGNLDAGDFLFL